MKKILAVLLPLALFAAASYGFDNDDSIVRWKTIVGVITSPGVDNPVGAIHSGATPWSVRGGRASVNLLTGFTAFEVDGLVINGGTSSGTPGPVAAVRGTLICDAGLATQTIHDTASVPLNVHGDAHFSGLVNGVPATCGNPLFLIRAGAAERWIATGAERFIGDDGK